ncbi:MAG: inorganic phosphate transporter [Flavobacteriaceae bacterium]
MENVYLFLILLLSLLAIGDLIVGVSNDAVNFLNSAIGSRVFSFRNIMIFASIGIACGAVFSSGMMEVARKGIFNPGAFYFDEIIFIFTAVMLTDILLLDFFNTLGMPTSTTVSIVFELLGAAVITALIKLVSKGESVANIAAYINTDKATQIIFGIVLSVFIAFTIGALVQWLCRLLIGYNFTKKRASNIIIGGLALSSISNFILIKGIKGTPFANVTFELLEQQTISVFMDQNSLLVNSIGFVFWLLFSYVFIRFLKINIYKVIIGVGTFALALAFAGNDLVNFIGVPIAAFQSYEAWAVSNLAASEFTMDVLAQKVPTPTFLLLGSGLIMILTLWFSSKAKRVVKTSLDLSNQSLTKERFKPNWVSRSIVRGFIFLSDWGSNLLSDQQKAKLSRRFTPIALTKDAQGLSPAFDTLRASINLVVAALLISWATSLKLPLSTTYVTFMVTMGTSLADRAWGSDSAVYRVAGVLNVISGWFFTAFIAFAVSGLIVYLIHLGGPEVVAIIFLLIVLIIGRNFIKQHQQSKEEKAVQQAFRMESKSFIGVIDESATSIATLFENSYDIYSKLVESLSKNKLNGLQKSKKEAKRLSRQIEELRDQVFYFIRNLEEKSISASAFYIQLLGILHDVSEDLNYLTKIGEAHVDNNHRKLKLSQIRDLDEIRLAFKKLKKETLEAFAKKNNIKEFEDVLLEKNGAMTLLEDKITTQIERTRLEETSPKNTTLYFNILLRSRDLMKHKFELIESFYKVVKNV